MPSAAVLIEVVTRLLKFDPGVNYLQWHLERLTLDHVSKWEPSRVKARLHLAKVRPMTSEPPLQHPKGVSSQSERTELQLLIEAPQAAASAGDAEAARMLQLLRQSLH